MSFERSTGGPARGGCGALGWWCRSSGPVAAIAAASLGLSLPAPSWAGYLNFESSHVHPIDLIPAGNRLLAVNTPDARLEIFAVAADGSLSPQASVPVGLEPVTVAARTDTEAWVVNHLSDTVSVVDLTLGIVTRTLAVGDEPTDVVFASGRAFVAVSQEDRVRVYNLAKLDDPPQTVELLGRDPRALAVSADGSTVYVVTLRSGNQTTVVNAGIAFGNNGGHNATRLQNLGLNPTECRVCNQQTQQCTDVPGPPYPNMPEGISRDPTLPDPPNGGVPPVGLIVRFDRLTGRWQDEDGQDWSHCLPFRLPDHDLFVINASTLEVGTVDHLGTSLFEVSVQPGSGRVYVPHTEARNFVRFEHPLGVQGHVVDNRLAVVDPAAGNQVTLVDLNAHIDRRSDPATNLAERQASVSQPGMMVWNAAGSIAYLAALGSRKVFRVDGACLSGGCIFGPSRPAPAAVVVGEGPTGVAWLESKQRLYVLNRFSNSIAIVDEPALSKIGEIPLHDSSSTTVRQGRRLLYDGIDTSGHGDAACASCHLSGDTDGLAWDLGNPRGSFQAYSTLNDNVRFILPVGGRPTECPPGAQPCSSHQGFDPQKGPMATQTLRGMLEPLHWRGDRPTFNDFNPAFVGLLGKEDIGPIGGKPAGLNSSDMELFRQFALGILFPPNPNRNVDDTLRNAPVPIPGHPFTGNPANGAALFGTLPSDAGQPCTACHALPFGTAGGAIGGVTPVEPTSPGATALFNGTPDGSPHSDLEVPHLRNMYEKFGPLFGSHIGPEPDRVTGFGYTHDGSIPDLGTFLSAGVFTLTAAQVRDLSAFMFAFPTGTRPAVGRQVTLAPGPPPPPPSLPCDTTSPECLLATLISVGDLASSGRHCELTATAYDTAVGRLRSWYLEGGLWVPDVDTESAVGTATLRQDADSALTFTCATFGSGVRLGADRDEDGVLNGDDCASADASSWATPQEVVHLLVDRGEATRVTWDDQSGAIGPGVRYDVAGADLAALRASGSASATCLVGGLIGGSFTDGRPDPAAGNGWYYLSRARNGCGAGPFGSAPADALTCPGS